MQEKFKSRWGLILSILGMAIGAGNIWRFPRLAGKYGNAFIILYVLFNLIWAIPLLMAEFSMGRATGKGIIGSISSLTSKKNNWLAAFITFVSSAILFYYSVVTGWALKYFFITATPGFISSNMQGFWEVYSTSKIQPVIFHIISVIIVAFIIMKGVKKGIERVNKKILPVLFFLLLIAAIYATTLQGAFGGIKYLFKLNFNNFSDPNLWIEAVSQVAWSTGAGWGLVLTYAAYMNENTNIMKTAFITVLGNGLAAILAAIAIISTVFAISGSSSEALSQLSKGNLGLTFIVLPTLFQKIPGGFLIAPAFFLALFLAAVSSMISLFEMLTKIFIDYKMERKKATYLVASLTIFFGIPSALYLGFFENQDWVWGLGLLFGGLFFAFFILQWGVGNFLKEVNLKIKYSHKIFKFIFSILIPLQFILMMGFWFYKTISGNPDWWKPFISYSIGTCLLQWIAVLIIFKFLNKRLSIKGE